MVHKKQPLIPQQMFIALNCFLFSACLTAATSYSYQSPKQAADGWQTANMATVVSDVSLIEKLFNQLKTGQHKVDSTVLVKDGRIILEEYFGEYGIDTQHDLRSVTKSIRVLLMGIAIDQGFIGDINDPIFKYLKSHRVTKNKHPLKQHITIKHLLTMSSGLDCNDWDKKSKGQEDRVYKKKDWIQYTLNLPLVNEPGTVSHYCSMGVVLATEIISQASDMPIDDFAEKFLFNPLDITSFSWDHTSKGRQVISAGKRLYMRPRDMAKIGQLVLQEGQWQDQQVVSPAWIQLVTSKQTTLASLHYGLLWWQIPFVVNNQTYLSITATGNGGQYIFVIPDLNLVAVFTGSAYNSEEDKLPFAVVKDIYIPTIIADR